MEIKFTTIDKLDDFLKTQLIALDAVWNQNRLVMPTLMLLYATLDIMAFLEKRGDDNQVGLRFRDFADQYIVRRLSGITAYDLWGARCSILHTATPESTSSKTGKAKVILYCYGKGDLQTLHKVMAASKEPEKYTAMSIEDLTIAIGFGIQEFLDDLKKDPTLCKDCEERVSKFYSYVPVPPPT